MAPGLFELRGFVAEGLREQGVEKGRLENQVAYLFRLLRARGLTVSDETSQRISECEDTAQLDLWFDRALTAATIEDVFAEPAPETEAGGGGAA